jgi:hypothetical protein
VRSYLKTNDHKKGLVEWLKVVPEFKLQYQRERERERERTRAVSRKGICTCYLLITMPVVTSNLEARDCSAPCTDEKQRL